MSKDRATFQRVETAGRSLILFGGVLADAAGQLMLQVARALAVGEAEQARQGYAELFAQLAGEVELGDGVGGDAWRNHLLERLLVDENPFSRKCETAGFAAVGPAVVEASASDLAVLRLLYDLDAGVIASAVGGSPPRLDGLTPMSARKLPPDECQLRRQLAAAADWRTMVEPLGRYYHESGAGTLARHRAFRWLGGATPIEPILSPDPIKLGDLIGYQVERELVVRNTEHFLAGHAANNVLLYGDRGTGKSSTVKALLNEYGERGLRLIEVPKGLLGELPSILGTLRGRRERFILFVDDLSFDDSETHYKDLKAILEGGIEARPHNVLLYATSNRRHLVAERFSDRGGPTDEIHSGDTRQEKLSFSDRFGISVTFAAPDQDRYLQIAAGLAAARGIELPADELRRRALEWATWQNGRSARTARQFVDFLAGELGLPPARFV